MRRSLEAEGQELLGWGIFSRTPNTQQRGKDILVEVAQTQGELTLGQEGPHSAIRANVEEELSSCRNPKFVGSSRISREG